MKSKEVQITKPDFEKLTGEKSEEGRFLVLHNDDFHTFDFVIDCLIEICNMDVVQAEQCTFLVHYKGKCDVKKGSFEFLEPFKEGLTTKGLSVTID
ncbi:MAG: ATP-dependent Clp protease adaptor ClpS [Bacteroidales bacterium]|nr:ATP-dependent Clp protease adaptor ClpS [Bacteroidales bacterium]